MARKRATVTDNVMATGGRGSAASTLKAPVVVEVRKPAAAMASSAAGASIAGMPAAKATATAGGTKPRPSHEMISRRAYEIWVAKGKPVGKDLENWQQAERELVAKV